MKKVLPIWKVLLIIFASFIVAGGMTGLGMYLLGKFNEKVVNPEDMSFSHDVSGEGQFNEAKNRFELCGNSQLLITTTTPEVTQTKVTLLFTDKDGGIEDQNLDENGYINNGSIKIPQVVEIGKKFRVELLTDEETGIIKGGESYIRAKSENNELNYINTKIVIDIPVEQLDLNIADVECVGGVYQVDVGRSFDIDAIFTPAKSEHAYQDTDDASVKEVYFSSNAAELRYDGGKTFSALNVTGQNAQVTAYAFSKAYYAEKFKEANPEATSRDAIDYLRNNPTESVLKTIDIKVISIDVETVIFAINDQTVDMNVDKKLTLRTNAIEAGEQSLGVTIKNSRGALLPALLGQVGIKLPDSADSLSVSGGRAARVLGTEISIINASDIEDDGAEYYILPHTEEIFSPNFYYWDVDATQTFENAELQLRFFYQEDGQWKMFSQNGMFRLTAKEHADGHVLWKDSEAISLTIKFKEDGQAIPDSKSLNELIKNINTEASTKDNVYKRIVYFLLVDDASVMTELNTVFDCKPAVEYTSTEISLSGVTPRDSYMLYEVNDDIITAYKSLRGTVKVVPAIVKTNSNGDVYKDGNKYLIANAGNAKTIVVNSTLSINKMSVGYHFNEDEIEKTEGGVTTGSIFVRNGSTFMPSVRKGENNQDICLIYFDLVLDSDDVDSDESKVLAAYRENKIKVVCLNLGGSEVEENYVYLSSLQMMEKTGDQITFLGTLAINTNLFNLSNAYNGVFVKLQFQYIDGEGEPHKKMVNKTDSEESGFYIYYQKPESLIGGYQASKSAATPINVNISISEGTAISWDEDEIGTTSDLMRDYLNFSIKDQYGKEIRVSDKEYKLKFVEEELYNESWRPRTSGRAVGFNSQGSEIMNFIPNGSTPVTTYVAVYVLDKEDQKVYGDTEETIQRFTFNIVGEGLKEVQYDVSQKCNNDAGYEQDLQKADSLGEITVSKKVKNGSVIELRSLFKIVTTEGDVDPNTDKHTIKLDSTYVSTFGNVASADMMKMVSFKEFEGDDFEVHSTLAECANLDIAEIKIAAPFNSRNVMVFNITDANGLYVVKLNVEFLTDIDTQSKFEEGLEKYQPYLSVDPNNPTAINVIGDGRTYSLNQWMPFTRTDYSWILSGENMARGFESTDSSIINDEGSSGTFQIKEVSHCKLVRITYYYGVKSQFAYSIDLNFYVHPNLALVEKITGDDTGAFVNVKDTKNLTNHYQFVKLTDYVDNITTTVALSSYMRFKNITNGTAYISLASNGEFSLEPATLNYQFGTSYEQTFEIIDSSETANGEKFDFVVFDKNGNVTLFNKNDASFTLQIGLESADEKEMIESIVVGARVVTYKGKPTLLLMPNSAGYELNGYRISRFKENTKINTNVRDKISIREFESFFIDDEELGLETHLGLLTVNVTLNIILTRIGDIFVYYDLMDNTDEDFAHLIGEIRTLENYNIYQELDAGQIYNVRRNSATEYAHVENLDLTFGGKKHYIYDSVANKYIEVVLYVMVEGNPVEATEPAESYCDSTGTAITDDIYEKVFGIYSVVNEIKNTITLSVASESIEGLARVIGNTQLQLSDLASDQDGQYVVLKIEVTDIQKPEYSFAWYYRIRVKGNFTKGSIVYPYDAQAEYLDTESDYYSKDTKNYTINLDSIYTEGTSKVENYGHSRFEDGSWVDTSVEKEYQVTSVKVNGTPVSDFSAYATISGNTLTINGSNEVLPIEIEITKTYTRDGITMLGADLTYLFKINQSTTYVQNVQHYKKVLEFKEEEKSGYYVYNEETNEYELATDPSAEDFEVGKYYKKVVVDIKQGITLSAADKPVRLEVALYKSSGPTTTKVSGDEYWVALVGNNGDYVDADFDWENEKLTLYPNSMIETNGQFTIEFYTQERIAFRIEVFAKSFFEIVDNYPIAQVDDGSMALFGNVVNVRNTRNGKSGNDLQHTIVAVANADYVEIDQGNKTLTFAYLEADKQIRFRDTVVDDDEEKGGIFVFEFTITVKAKNTPFIRTSVTNNVYQYGQVEFDVDIADSEDIINTILNDPSKTLIADADDYVKHIFVTPENVGVATVVTKKITLVYQFNSNADAIEREISYTYTTYPNVVFTTHYPDPDGSGENNKEYIKSGNTIKLSEVAEFATGARVSVDFVDAVSSAGIEKEFEGIEVSGTSNVTYQRSGSGQLAEAFTLTLQDASANGYIIFTVTYNSVVQSYRIDVISTNTVKVRTNSPNYLNNQETVYVEDLSDYTTSQLFAADRILKMKFASNVTVGTQYFVRLRHGTTYEVKVVPVTVATTENYVNVDMGDSYTDYGYQGTYATESAAQSGGVDFVDGLYLVEPFTISRIEFTYYTESSNENDAYVIKDVTAVVYRREGDESSPTYTPFTGLEASDFNPAPTKINLSVKRSDDDGEEYLGTYAIMPAVEFEVRNAARWNDATDSPEFSAAIINADTSVDLSLLEYFTVFGITNTRTNELYTPRMMANSKGKLSVEIYGFESCPINNDDVSAKYHNYKNGDITYDITPRANGYKVVDGVGYDNRPGHDETNLYNYIILSAKQGIYNDKGVEVVGADWAIMAQGARNEGDYVMLKIKYTVEFQSDSIVVERPVLIQVLPNSRITLGGTAARTETDVLAEGAKEGNIWASNKQTMITVINNPKAAETNNKQVAPAYETSEGALNTDVVAYMYGNNGDAGNNAAKIRFTYTLPTEVSLKDDANKYNDYLFHEDASQTLAQGGPSDTLQLKMPKLTLGYRYYYIEAENKFNYKMRIYYKLFGDVNPSATINSTQTTLKEGQPIVFGAAYSPLTGQTATIKIKDLTGNINDAQLHTFSSYIDEDDDNKIKQITWSNVKVAAEIPFENWIVPNNLDIYLLIYGQRYSTETTDVEDGTLVGWIHYNSEARGYDSVAWYTDQCVEVTSIPTIDEDTSVYIGFSIAAFDSFSFTDVKFNELNGSRTRTMLTRYNETGNEEISLAKVQSMQDSALKDNAALIIMRGISAYGFANSSDIVDYLGFGSYTSAQDFKSYVGNIYITGIELRKYGMETAQSFADPSNSHISYTGEDSHHYVPLAIDSGYTFLNVQGSGTDTYSSNAELTKVEDAIEVPSINGVYYGTSNRIENVTLVIYFEDSVGNKGTNSDIVVAIEKDDTAIFGKQKLLDDESLAAASPRDINILNDTLEVYLNPKVGTTETSVSFMLTNALNEKETEMVTLTNDKPYAVTKYIGISSSVNLMNGTGDGATMQNLRIDDKINIANVNGTADWGFFRYNGHEYSGATQFSIETLVADQVYLHFNNESEVSGLSSPKSSDTTLYFIYYTTGDSVEKYYQKEVTFSVYPTYYKIDAQPEDKTTQGQITFVVDNYNYFVEGQQYVIKKDIWASHIYLMDNNHLGEEYSSGTQLSSMNENYKLIYEINTGESGGGGAAYIDEFGNIVTTKDFVISDQTITINIYMKVSGADRKWNQISDNKLKLGSARVSLQNGISPLLPIISTEIYNESTEFTPGLNTDDGVDYAFEVGTNLNLKEMFDPIVKEKARPTGTGDADKKKLEMDNNFHYHIVSVTKDNEVVKHIMGNNMDSWKFDEAGTYKLRIVITGYDSTARDASSGAMTKRAVYKDVNFYIYDTSTHVPNYVYLQVGEEHEYSANDWKICDDGQLVSLPNESFTESGRYEREVLTLTDQGEYKKATYSRYIFYVYSNDPSSAEYAEKFDVVKTQNGRWSLNQLNSKLGNEVSGWYEFDESATHEDIQSVTTYSGTQAEQKYLVRFNNGTYKVVTIQFYIVDNTIQAEAAGLRVGYVSTEETAEERQARLKDVLIGSVTPESGIATGSGILKSFYDTFGIIPNNPTIFEVPDNTGILKEMQGPDTLDVSVFTKTYVIVNNNIAYKLAVTFFPYIEELTFSADATPSTAWALSNLNDEVVQAIEDAGIPIESGAAIRYYTSSGSILNEVLVVSTESLAPERPITGLHYYVYVGGKYYYINVTLTKAESQTLP